jgi:hypothetical protein
MALGNAPGLPGTNGRGSTNRIANPQVTAYIDLYRHYPDKRHSAYGSEG